MTLYCCAVPACTTAATNLAGWQAEGRLAGQFVLQAVCKSKPISPSLIRNNCCHACTWFSPTDFSLIIHHCRVNKNSRKLHRFLQGLAQFASISRSKVGYRGAVLELLLIREDTVCHRVVNQISCQACNMKIKIPVCAHAGTCVSGWIVGKTRIAVTASSPAWMPGWLRREQW